MNKNKKTLGFLIFVNCLFFVGVGLITAREIADKKQKPLHNWLATAAMRTAPPLHLRRTKTKEQMQMVLNTAQPALKKKMAESFNIVALLEKNKDQLIELYGTQKKDLYSIELYDKNTNAAYRDGNNLYFTYFYGQNSSDLNKQLAVVLQRQIAPIIEALELIGIDISILEEVPSKKEIVFSSLPDDAAKELLKNIDFQKHTNTDFDDIQNIIASISSLTLGNQRYLVVLYDLVFTENFKQKIAYTLLVPDYETVSLSDFSIAVIVIFFVMSLLSFYAWTRLKN